MERARSAAGTLPGIFDLREKLHDAGEHELAERVRGVQSRLPVLRTADVRQMASGPYRIAGGAESDVYIDHRGGVVYKIQHGQVNARVAREADGKVQLAAANNAPSLRDVINRFIELNSLASGVRTELVGFLDSGFPIWKQPRVNSIDPNQLQAETAQRRARFVEVEKQAS